MTTLVGKRRQTGLAGGGKRRSALAPGNLRLSSFLSLPIAAQHHIVYAADLSISTHQAFSVHPQFHSRCERKGRNEAREVSMNIKILYYTSGPLAWTRRSMSLLVAPWKAT